MTALIPRPVLLKLAFSFALTPTTLVAADTTTVTQWPTSAVVEIRVTDSTGAVVERAEVVIESPGGGRAVAPSASSGLHRVQLGAGRHVITVFEPGFEPVTREVTVTATSSLSVDVVLQPAALTEQITVTGATRFEGAPPVSGARMPIATLDLPQSVEVVSQAVLQTQAETSMQEALLDVAPQLGEGRRDQVALRGFSAVDDHTGEVLGVAGQTVGGIASGCAVLLVWTELSLAWRRTFGRQRADATRREIQEDAA